ncbi:RES family NAD+ phosphorylase [Nitrosomonas aestuarii]|uniref:RES family NAD+ phosphorylase n=1 Tax=Nitrosomonas aestuarii TaxID=52441 RepID=UPI000D325AD0|nr:RES family NAD+ phosphorylase [Nitrosomonas aestuarii]PTN08250.1 RES domain-containing protein [Nitrosomonas aestuarii]
MFAWRIAKKRRALDRSGVGASIKGQRWNNANITAIYAGLTLEIAAMEKLVHTGSILPPDLVVVRIKLPADKDLYDIPDPNSLPEDWNTLPGSPAAAAYGDAFLFKGEQLGLIVPSAVIPEAKNIVINPNHPRMREVTMEIIRDFSFDPRLRS